MSTEHTKTVEVKGIKLEVTYTKTSAEPEIGYVPHVEITDIQSKHTILDILSELTLDDVYEEL